MLENFVSPRPTIPFVTEFDCRTLLNICNNPHDTHSRRTRCSRHFRPLPIEFPCNRLNESDGFSQQNRESRKAVSRGFGLFHAACGGADSPSRTEFPMVLKVESDGLGIQIQWFQKLNPVVLEFESSGFFPKVSREFLRFRRESRQKKGGRGIAPLPVLRCTVRDPPVTPPR